MLIKRFFGFMRPRSRGDTRDVEIYTKNASQLSHLVRIASKKGFGDHQFWRQVTTRLQYVANSLNARHLTYIANGLARAGIVDKHVWDMIVQRYYQLQDQCGFQEHVLIANALAKVKTVDHSILQHVPHIIKDGGAAVPPRYIAVIINALACANYRDHRLIETLLRQINYEQSPMSIASIAILLDGLCTLAHRSKVTMIQLSKQLVINLSKYQSAMTYAESLQSIRGDKNATQLDKSSSDCEGGGPRQSCEIDGMLSGEEHQLNRTIFVGPDGGHKSTLKDIQDKHVDDTKITQHLAVIHRAYSYFGHYDKPLFDLLFKLMASQHQRFKPIEVVMVANSMAKSKLHDEQVIRLFGEIIIKRRKQFTMEMVAIFLNGICMPSGNDQAMFAKILSNMMQRKYQGVITGKNCLTALQVLSKVKLKDDTLTQYFIHSLLEFINDLNSLDLANAVSYITKLCPQCEQVEHLVKRYMEIYDKNDIIKNAQHVSILFYALSRTSQGFFEKYCRQLIVLLENIPSELYEPIHVTNILKAMTTLDLRNVKHISEFSRYTENNMSKFNPQLLSSTLESLYNVGGITEALWLAFCKHVNRIKKASLCDHICYLYVLTMEASAERLNDIGRKYDFLAALDTTIRGIRDSCSNLTTNSPVMFKLKDSIKQFATLRDLFGSDDSEIVESVIEMDETLANIIEGTVKS